MSPNLFLAFQTLATPHQWFKRPKGEKPTRKIEHWDSPVPGKYEHIPGRGWYLVALDPGDKSDGQHPEYSLPRPVIYSRVLKRYLFKDEYAERKRHTTCREMNSANGSVKVQQAGFFQLDDRTAWVKCWDENGEFIPGPYERWCLDKHTGQFRKMVKGDDPGWLSRHSSVHSNSDASSSGDPASVMSGFSTPRTKQSSTRASSMRTFTAPSTPPSFRMTDLHEEREAITPENVARALARKGKGVSDVVPVEG